ncbi:hypothetical protein PaG_04370 [Moesziomyces aphidis]|uniref:Uncharacterized protein n=1 Tax=Moesziomyces aphidis TaxID=84754 RepID=W3VKS1_MOEAP|nr:hypothetical protein PaG_04370 [Moesziomyces aphidis]
MVAKGASSVSTRLSRPIWPRGIFPSPNANRSDSAHALVLLVLLALLALLGLFLARPKAMPRAKLTRFACNANLRALPPPSTETGQRSMAGIFVRPLHLLCSAPRIGAALRTLRSKDFLVLPTGPDAEPNQGVRAAIRDATQDPRIERTNAATAFQTACDAG